MVPQLDRNLVTFLAWHSWLVNVLTIQGIIAIVDKTLHWLKDDIKDAKSLVQPLEQHGTVLTGTHPWTWPATPFG
jgi:hypothetical protein